jgi:ABC-type multidrug transport system fused ATPase/permease subunit
MLGVWDQLTFGWMKPLLSLGSQKPLEQDDLYDLSPEDSAEGISRAFRKEWVKELEKQATSDRVEEKKGVDPYGKKKTKASLTNAYVRSLGMPFLLAGILKLLHDSTIFIGPYILNKLIRFLADPNAPVSEGYHYVIGLFVSYLFMSLCLRQYFWWCFRVGMRVRSAVVTSVYSKSLSITMETLNRRNTGEITNLMAVDSTRLQDLTPYLHAIWYSFYQLVVALFFLWEQLGTSCLAGIAVIVLSIPVTGKISLYMKSLQKAMSSVRDERIKLSNEVLAGMKVIKLQAWEKEYQRKIEEIRNEELALMKKYVMAQAYSGTLFGAIPMVVAICTFMAYIAMGNSLDVATALTSLALFDILRFPLFMLPNVINNVVEAKVSVDRVQVRV